MTAVPAATNRRYGWLFPVAPTSNQRRDNCVVYMARGTESLHQVARLFGLSVPRLLADNQGVVSEAHQALGGRSILLCGQYGQAAPQPVRPAAAAKADTADLEAVLPVRRQTLQTAAPAPPAVSPKEQEQALLQLKAVLDPKGEVLNEWGPTQVAPESKMAVASHCSWSYVLCDANSNVVRLNLVYLGLDGKLPAGSLLVKLPRLTELYLGGNELKGTLPADWATSTKLTQLYLNDNQLTGALPAAWGNFKTLRALSLPYNQLTGSLPATWAQLQSLQELKLNDNQLSGPVPSSWGRLNSLSTITLWNNAKLSGCLPSEWESKSSNSKGFFQSPTGVRTNELSVVTMGTALKSFCGRTPVVAAPTQPAAAQPTAKPATQSPAVAAGTAAGRGAAMSPAPASSTPAGAGSAGKVSGEPDSDSRAAGG